MKGKNPYTYALTKEDLQRRVLYQDALLLVINKPAAIPVHAGPSKEPSLEDYFDALQFGAREKPRLAHRLDRDTSGCLILGRQQKALPRLGRLFEKGLIKKTYWAIVHGTPKENSGTIDTFLEKVKTPKGWYMRVCGEKEGAQRAITCWKVLKEMGDKSLIEFSPRTGRTHQIRIHAESIGCPIVGDWVYGPEAEMERPPPLALHAREIEIPIYPDKPVIRVTAPPPPHMEDFCLIE